MQKYHPKTPVAEVTDRLFRAIIAVLTGISWFVFLWGFSLPALTAGIALGAMLWLCIRQFSKQATSKREQQMRRLIGGELALNQLLLESPRKSAFQCALWLTPRYPVVMQKSVEWGIIGILNGKRTCIRLLAYHETHKITPQQVLECAREAREKQVEQTLLCLTAPAAADTLSYAATLDPPIKIIQRDELIELAGYAHPATDEDLRMLGRQKRTRRSTKEWLAVVLDASRARRYFWYGLGLSLMALMNRNGYYPIPAALCLGMYAACKLNQRMHWTA